MADVRMTEDELRIELSRWERIGALSGDVIVPTTAIVDVERVAPARSAIRGMRAPGTGWPGRIALGHWRKRGVHDFVAAYRDDPGYVISLRDHDFDRVVVSTPPIPALDALARI